jgi:DNA-directed RNA polymerase subunit H (RpoH/RPB5)
MPKPLTAEAKARLEYLLGTDEAQRAIRETKISKTLLRKGLIKEADHVADWLGKKKIDVVEINEAYASIMGRWWAVRPWEFKRSLQD